MTDLTLHLPPELSKRLVRAASQDSKAPEVLALEVLERFLEDPSRTFMGAWANSNVTPETILRTRKPGGLKQRFEAAGFAAESVGDALLEPAQANVQIENRR